MKATGLIRGISIKMHQSKIAEEVAKQLDLTVLEPERRALYEQPTDNLEAYDYYLKGITRIRS